MGYYLPGVVLRVPAIEPCHPLLLARSTDSRAYDIDTYTKDR